QSLHGSQDVAQPGASRLRGGGVMAGAGARPGPFPFATRLDHVGIAVADLSQALAFYPAALGMRVAWGEVVEEQGVRAAFLSAGGTGPAAQAAAEIELLLPTRDESAIARFLARRGPGMHHVAFEVPDIAEASAACRAHGLRLIDEVPRRGARGHLI